MRVIVTCGPSYEPIDGMRRLTNASTGGLGLQLAAALGRAGHEVICMKGQGAVSRLDAGGAQMMGFSTNENLLERLRGLSVDGVSAVFHAAALCDYRVKSVHTADGALVAAKKIPTRAGEVTLTLEPAVKVLPELRAIFPTAKIVGWKYELDGTPEDAVAKGREQLAACRSDACVVNGAAWGRGFGFVEPAREVVSVRDTAALCALLAQWFGAGK